MSEIEAVVREELERFRVPGAGVTVVQDGAPVLAQGFGFRDADQELPVTDRTLFPIGSTTKAFTASVIGTFVDEGLLEWDRPVRDYIPGFQLFDPFATQELTLRDMLSHRSGLPRHDMLMLMYGGGQLSRAELVKRLRYLAPNKSLREEWQYNNLIYMAAGYLIEVVAGLTWEEAVQERLLDPLGMSNTNFSLTESQKSDDHSLPYSEVDEAIVQVPFRNIEMVGPAGSINSCIADMAQWLSLNAAQGTGDKRSILSAAALKQIHAPAMALPEEVAPWDEVNAVGYGLGWLIEDYRGHRLIWHNGGVDGFKTVVAFIPKEKVGVVVLSNRFPCDAPEAIAYRVFDELLGLDPLPWGERYLKVTEAASAGAKQARAHQQSSSKGTPPSHPLEEFAGTYSNPGYGQISFDVVEGELVGDLHELRLTFHHRHFNVWDAHMRDFDIWMPFNFSSNVDGEISRVEAQLEASVDPIVFEKGSDARLSDPSFLATLAGTYKDEARTLVIESTSETLRASMDMIGTLELVPRLGLRFGVKEQAGITFEFVSGDDGSIREIVIDQFGVFTRVEE